MIQRRHRWGVHLVVGGGVADTPSMVVGHRRAGCRKVAEVSNDAPKVAAEEDRSLRKEALGAAVVAVRVAKAEPALVQARLDLILRSFFFLIFILRRLFWVRFCGLDSAGFGAESQFLNWDRGNILGAIFADLQLRPALG